MRKHKSMPHKRRIPNSIFLKLLMMLIGTGFILIVLVGMFFRHFMSDSSENIVEKNTLNYARYLVEEIGNPPDTLMAKNIAEKYSLLISFSENGRSWSSDRSIKFTKASNAAQADNNRRWQHGYYLITFEQNGFDYIFGLKFDNRTSHDSWLIFVLLFLIGAVLFGLYIAIRRVLRPIKWLDDGARLVGKGNLDHKVRIKKMDELGQLTQSFNSMTNRIKEMLKARDQLLLDVSHELRSPLTRIKVALEFLNDEKSKGSIGQDIREMEQMLTEILESERMNSAHSTLKLEKTDIVQLLTEIAETFESTPPRLDISAIQKPMFLFADKERIKICLRNLIENALKFSTDSAKPVQISLVSILDNVEIRVQDHGIGIPAEELPFIFEPFYRVDKSRSKKTGGYGLGMSLCKKIIEAHQGTIEIKSELKKGSLIVIKLPESLNPQKD